MPESTNITGCGVHSDCTASTMSYAFHRNDQPIMTLILWLIIFAQCLKSIPVTFNSMICAFHLCYIISICDWILETDQIITLGLIYFIGPANGYTCTLHIHSAITRLG